MCARGVKPKRATKTIGGYKKRENKVPGRKSRTELMGVKGVEVVQDKYAKYGDLADTFRASNSLIKRSGISKHRLEELEEEERKRYAKSRVRY